MPGTDDLEEMYEGIRAISGEDVEVICRGLVSKRISQNKPVDDWNVIVGEAKSVMKGHVAVLREIEAQAEVAFRSNIVLADDED